MGVDMKKFLLPLLLLTSSIASAQVVQPQYVRPSKGAPLTLATVTASSVTATFTNSAIFDWTAFAGVVVTVNQTAPTGTFSTCKHGVTVKALGSTTTVSGDFFLLNVANNDYRASVSQSWYTRVLPGYLRFSIGTYEANSSGQPSCGYRVVATPLPFDYSGELVSTGVASLVVTGDGEIGAATITFTSTYPNVRVQNRGDSAAYCTPVTTAGTYDPDSNNWPIALGSGLYPSDKAGDSVLVTNWVGLWKCLGTVGVFSH